MTSKKWEIVGPEHGMTKLKAALFKEHLNMCGELQISPWDFCAALANVQAEILASSRDMPKEKALERLDALRVIAGSVYEKARTAGEA